MRDVLQNAEPIKNIATHIKSAALISLILVLPFAILEILHNTITKQNAPGLILLFALLWLLATAFIVLFAPILQSIRAGKNLLANPVTLFFKVIFLLIIVAVWGVVFVDQLPCFIGIPNCD